MASYLVNRQAVREWDGLRGEDRKSGPDARSLAPDADALARAFLEQASLQKASSARTAARMLRHISHVV